MSQDKNISPTPLPLSWSSHIGTDTHNHRGESQETDAAFPFVYDDVPRGLLHSDWRWTKDEAETLKFIDEAEEGLQKVVSAKGNDPLVRDIMEKSLRLQKVYQKRIGSPFSTALALAVISEEDIPILRLYEEEKRPDTPPPLKRARHLVHETCGGPEPEVEEAEIFDTSDAENDECRINLEYYSFNDEADGCLVHHEDSASDSVGGNNLQEETPEWTVDATVETSSDEELVMPRTAGEEQATGAVRIDKGKQRIDSSPLVSGQEAQEQATLVDNEPQTVSKGLTIEFLRWRFDLVPEQKEWSCPFPPSLHMKGIRSGEVINQCAGILFSDVGVEKHVTVHLQTYKKTNPGHALPCPFRNQQCDWEARENPQNDTGYARHVAQKHMRTGILRCPCGDVMARRNHWNVVRHLEGRDHIINLCRKDAQFPGTCVYPYVNDARLLQEQKRWRNRKRRQRVRVVDSGPASTCHDVLPA